MIIATAGHIDHGKTALIRALTGVDTDRLPEEKARGISIDLGFAYLTLGDGTVLGFVDVPGHERFVRNMLAGVCGIDFAILVVAADDGVMPQTLEHVAILQLLRIDKGVAVVSKTDAASAERVREVVGQVRELLARTPLAAIPVREVSSVTGAGLAALREDLEAAARTHASRWQKGGHFRLAIDRVFSVAGSGTVVTGTVFDGSVAVGARCVLSPKGTTVRVRGLEMRGQAVDSIGAGSRCAINLAGVEVAEVTRGDWLVSPQNHAPTQRLDTTLSLLASETHPLAHQTPVHLHLGTTDVVARIATRRGVPIGPGTTAHAQLVLERPVAAFVGDRFIIRDQAARRTLGGGAVIDPFPAADRRGSLQNDAVRRAMSLGEPRLTLAALLQISDHAIDLRRFERAFNLTNEHAAALYREAAAVTLGRDTPVAIPAANVRLLEERVLETLARPNRAEPHASGIGLDALRKAVAPYLPPEAFLSLIRELGFRRKVELANSIVQLSGHSGSFSPADEVLWQRVLPAPDRRRRRAAARRTARGRSQCQGSRARRPPPSQAKERPRRRGNRNALLSARVARAPGGFRRAPGGRQRIGRVYGGPVPRRAGHRTNPCDPYSGALRPDGCHATQGRLAPDESEFHGDRGHGLADVRRCAPSTRPRRAHDERGTEAPQPRPQDPMTTHEESPTRAGARRERGAHPRW